MTANDQLSFNQETTDAPPSRCRTVRCTVVKWDDHQIVADTGDGTVTADYSGMTYLRSLLKPGMQLHLADVATEELQAAKSAVLHPTVVIVEPDFLIDISAVAACFAEMPPHPLTYTRNRLKKRLPTQPILLGNFAGTALDAIIAAEDDKFCLKKALWRSFREQLLPFCACDTFNAKKFRDDAMLQARNLEEVVELLFGNGAPYDRAKAIVEPTFICPELGLQGRVDLMTTDMRLLVEQKSGHNYRIERNAAIRHREDHYVQLLLYHSILKHNFHLDNDHADIRLLYSKYPPNQGLLAANYQHRLFCEAIRLRNLIVSWEYHFAANGFPPSLMTAGNDTRTTDGSANAEATLEDLYISTMATFVYREQLRSRIGGGEGMNRAVSDLWNMTMEEKTEQGNILAGLRLTERQRSSDYSGYDLLTLTTRQAEGTNFRRGDMVYLYAYDGTPDVRHAILFKGTLQQTGSSKVVVRLINGQHNPDIFPDTTYAIEPGGSDSVTTGNLHALRAFAEAPQTRRDLLLGRRTPRADHDQQLTHSYHPDYDDMLLRAKQAKDYFLLIGPPGTGKTSMALRFLVEEELQTEGSTPSLLLTAYTNRAVDEICGMLTNAGIDYLRLGSETSCDPRYANHLTQALFTANDNAPAMADVKRRIETVHVIVATTAMLQSQPFIFQLKHFSTCIVDEASQILEPSVVGILSQDIGRFILIGDHKQLPAVVQQPTEETRVSEPRLRAIGITDCRHSLFERLLRWERTQGRTQFVGVLNRQGRMHPDIAAFPTRMFYFNEQLQPVPLPHQMDTSLHYATADNDTTDRILQQQRVVFFPTPPQPAAEARLTAMLLQRIYRYTADRFDPNRTVGVIVPYRSQIALIRSELEQAGINDLLKVSIDTVERYQGSQRDVIVYSFCVNQPWQLDFLTANCFEEDGHTIDRKLNVAITRARCQLLLTGYEPLLRTNPIFNALIDEAARCER